MVAINPKSPVQRRRLPRAERDEKILTLAGACVPYRRIAEETGSSLATVSRVVNNHLAQLQATIKVRAGELRAKQLFELQALRQRLAKGVAAGDTRAISTWIKAQHREAQLCGLDLVQAAADEAAHHHAARALLDSLEGRVSDEVMDQVVAILSELAEAEETDE